MIRPLPAFGLALAAVLVLTAPALVNNRHDRRETPRYMLSIDIRSAQDAIQVFRLSVHLYSDGVDVLWNGLAVP
jgi:hypothetical protein